MLLLGYLLVPILLAASDEFAIDDYVVKIEDNVLTSVRAENGSSDELNLSGLGFEHVDENVFRNLTNLKMLNLANNTLWDLPPSVFSNLTNLEYLSLADNSLDRLTDVFVGLENLKSLNISNNLMKTIEPCEFYGLSRYVDILTQGNPLKKISTLVFEKDTDPVTRYRPRREAKKTDEDSEEEKSSSRAKLCIYQGIVKHLNMVVKKEIIPNDCMEIEVREREYLPINLNLSNLGITGFEKGWYGITKKRDININLANNKLVRIGPEVLNELPSSVTTIDLSGNKIERLENGTINNFHVKQLLLNNNDLRVIEDGALQSMSLTDLHLNNNHLNDTKFMSTLPISLSHLQLKNNKIAELSDGATSKLEELVYLDLDENYITDLCRESLRGLNNLWYLELSNNRITTMETGCFRDLRSLQFLFLNNNSIANLDSGVFDGPENLLLIDMSQNKLKKLKKNVVPHKVSVLCLDYNEIECLEPGSLAIVPINMVSLDGNKLTEIPKGLFKASPRDFLKRIIRADFIQLFRSLFHLRFFKPNVNTNRAIEKALKFSKQDAISTVDLSSNKIRRLVNGALFGIFQHETSWIHVSNCPIELIQGGLFDNV